MRILENIPLAPLTTFQVGGTARFFVEAHTEQEAKDALAYAAEHKLPLFVLGGGSNLVVSDSGWPGLVMKISLAGVEFEGDIQKMRFQSGAGESWDNLVALTVSKNCGGLECLSGIPGTVGGTPVQNVGAYGQEVSETISWVKALEIATGKTRELRNADCGFAYRTSMFNTTHRDQYIVLEVAYLLHRNTEPKIEYGDLKKFFANSSTIPTLQQVRDAVRSIRQSKAMLIVQGDEDSQSAGSFFKNPVVTQAEADRVQALAEKYAPGKPLPRYPVGDGEGHIKLAAAWLVEQSGFHKGYGTGPVGISRKHTLAIVNRGGATAKDILALKNEIQKKVLDMWGVELQPEPVFVGF